uniref:Uncharacterized protein n=1 Tax=Ciona intestinalis TaxID=7719 RepID=H2Y3C2_CIOIN
MQLIYSCVAEKQSLKHWCSVSYTFRLLTSYHVTLWVIEKILGSRLDAVSIQGVYVFGKDRIPMLYLLSSLPCEDKQVTYVVTCKQARGV